MQGLSDLFVADYGKFFDVEQLRAATARLKRRHAIFKSWQSEIDKDFGLRRKGSSIDTPRNIGSMSEHDFFLFFDCPRLQKFCHLWQPVFYVS